MLPVVRGDRETARQIVLYSAGLVAVTLLPFAFGSAGLLYLASALALGGGLRLARRAAAPRLDAAPGRVPLPLLAPLPRASLRGPRNRHGGALMDPDLARRNARLGWLLFGVFLLLFAGTFGIALLYLQRSIERKTLKKSARRADWRDVARLRRLCIAVVVLGALAGFSSHRALAATPAALPAAAQHLASAHFTRRLRRRQDRARLHHGDAGRRHPRRRRARIRRVRRDGLPAAARRTAPGKTGISVVNLVRDRCSRASTAPATSTSTPTDVGTDDTAYSVGFDVFGRSRSGSRPTSAHSYSDTWLIQGIGSWASCKALGYPACLRPPTSARSRCRSTAGIPRTATQACSKDGYDERRPVTLAASTSIWPSASAPTSCSRCSPTRTRAAQTRMTGLQTALDAHGTSLSAEYAAFATKLIAGGWAAPSLNLASPPISGAVDHDRCSHRRHGGADLRHRPPRHALHRDRPRRRRRRAMRATRRR